MRRQKAFPIFGGLTVLLLVVFFVWWFGRDASYAVVRPASSLVQGPDNAGVSGPELTAARDTSLIPIGTAQRSSPAPVDSNAGQGARRDAPVSTSKKAARTALKSSGSLSPSDDTKTAAALTEVSDITDPADRTYKLSSEPLSDRPVNVSSGVMKANLISGPQPSYPVLANLTHMRGEVVMLAVISKDGTVKDLHVIKGHRLLRGAAKSAVRNWRYRPYRINGVPVDVSTLVSVDFSSQE